MKQVASMALAKKKNNGLIFENHAGVTVIDILLDDDANKAFNKINGNIAGVEWEAEPLEQEIQEVAVKIARIQKNQYAALADDEGNDENEDKQENDTKSTGVENSSKSTGVCHENESTGVDSNNESTGIKSESDSTGAADEADEMTLIEETIAEAERDIVEGKEKLAGAETKTEDTREET